MLIIIQLTFFIERETNSSSVQQLVSADNMLELRNSRLNFYRLQQQSAPTRVQELLKASSVPAPSPPQLDVSPPSSSISPARVEPPSSAAAIEPIDDDSSSHDDESSRFHTDPQPLVHSEHSSNEVKVVSLVERSPPEQLELQQALLESVVDIPPTPTLPLEERLELLDAMQDETRVQTQHMQQQKKRYQRDADTVTDNMVEDTKRLLSLFGIPFIVAPAEAEAQVSYIVFCTQVTKNLKRILNSVLSLSC